MKKIKTFNYLKHYRENSGFSLQDMAGVLGMNPATLSRIESGIITPNLEVILGYQSILDISSERLFKEHLRMLITYCLEKAKDVQDDLLDQKSTKFIHKRLSLLDIIISRLQDLKADYE